MAHTASTTAPSDYGTSGSHSRGQLAVSKSDDMLMGDNGILPIKVGPTTESGTQKVADEDFIKRIVNKAVQDVIEDEPYSHDASSLWTNKIAELLVRTFVNIDRDNKYIGMLSHPLPVHSRVCWSSMHLYSYFSLLT